MGFLLAGSNAVISHAELLSSESRQVMRPAQVEESSFDGVEVPRISPLPVAVEGIIAPVIHLNGMWKFSPSPGEGFESVGEVSGWVDIAVPGEWATQGFDVPEGAWAGYFHTFEVPADWHSHVAKLRLDAVYSETVVWLNGREAGCHEGGFTAFELDVTRLLKPGRVNTLALAVKNESVADSLASGSRYACHPLGGISRSVRLFALPEVHVASLVLRTDLDADHRDAQLEVLVEMANEADEPSGPLEMEAVVSPLGGSLPLARSRFAARVDAVDAGTSVAVGLEQGFKAPSLWNCETPNLYELELRLTRDGRPLQVLRERFGFREIETRGADLLVNGTRVTLRGSNRHEVHPRMGRVLPREWYRRDVELFREGNVNLLRTCHYPPDEELLRMCDELGMFVEVEAPFCWAHETRQPLRRIHELTILQNMEMVTLLRNHPSVLMWSLGNESKWNEHFAAASEAVRKLDPTRPVVFDTWDSHADPPHTQLGSWHYPGIRESYGDGRHPRILGEYCHVNAYNRFELATDQVLRDRWGIYLDRIWQAVREDPTCSGGAIWSGIDDTFFWDYRGEGGAVEQRTVGYGTWGVIDGWRRRKPEWWGMKKAYSPVRIDFDAIKVEGTAVSIPVENRLDFRPLNALDVRWRVGRQHGALDSVIEPHTSGMWRILLREKVPAGAVLELSVNDPRGFQIDSFRVPLGDRQVEDTPGPDTSCKASERDGKLVVAGSAGLHVIDKTSGMLEGDGVTGPRLMILPLNGGGNTQMHGPTEVVPPFTDPCADWRLDSVHTANENGSVTVEVKGRTKEAAGRFVYRFLNDGSCSIEYDFEVLLKEVNPRQLGVVFDCEGDYKTLHWEREGYWSTYPEWHIARLVGTASADVGVPVGPVGPRDPPKHEWRHDRTAVGSHDFASTKHNIRSSGLTAEDGRGVQVFANGDRHVRAWIHGDKGIRLLAAHFSNGGNERFLRRISSLDDRPLRAGDRVSSSVRVKFVGKE